MLNRRRFLQTTGILAGGEILFPSIGRGAQNRRPNILLILSDQERENVPRELLHLPHRERLEERGMRLTNAFCATPQCSASRAALLTGRYPHEAGVVTNVDGNSLGFPLNQSIPCLGSVFQQQGYATGYLGKWHLGNDKDGLDPFGFPGYKNLRGQKLADAAAKWIQEQSAQPWLLMVSFINPHDIYQIQKHLGRTPRNGVQLPPNFEDTLWTKPSPQKRFLTHDQGKVTLQWGEKEWLAYRDYYLELIEKIDGHLGVILNQLEAKGQWENTIVVYASDHGDMGGAHRLPYKGPFMYDELLNVPLTISYPARFEKSVTSGELVSLVDLIPTLCGLTGVSWPEELKGRSIEPLFESSDAPIRDEIFAEYYSKQKWVNPIRTIRTNRWKYNLYTTGGEELYNLRRDGGELKNLAADPFHSDTKKHLHERLNHWRIDTHDPLL